MLVKKGVKTMESEAIIFVALAAIVSIYYMQKKITINHRWQKTFNYTFWLGMMGLFLSLFIMIARIPGVFRDEKLVEYNDLAVKEHQNIFLIRQEFSNNFRDLRESIRNECLLNKDN